MRRSVAAIAGVLAVWYAALATQFDFRLLTGQPTAMVFNAMLASLLDGRFDVAPDPIGLEGFLRDGHVYAYFGILPALLRLPLLLVPDGLAINVNRLSVVIAAVFALYWQLRAIGAVYVAVAGNRIAERLLLCLAVGAMLGGPNVQFLNPSVYIEAIGWAGAFAAMFVACAAIGLTSPTGFNSTLFNRMALAAGLALITRVSTGVGLYAALGLLMLWHSWPGRMAPVAWLRAMLAPRMLVALAILVAFLAATLGVNWARWGNPFTVMDVRLHIMNIRYPERMARVVATGEFNVGRLWFGLMYYFAPIWFLYPPGGNLLFADYAQRLVETELPPGSFLLSDPLLLILGAMFLAQAWRRRRECAATLALAAGLLLPILLMLTMIFMNFRYRPEFYPFLTLIALAGVLALARHGGGERLARWAWPLTLTGVLFAHFQLFLHMLSDPGPAGLRQVQSFLKHLGF